MNKIIYLDVKNNGYNIINGQVVKVIISTYRKTKNIPIRLEVTSLYTYDWFNYMLRVFNTNRSVFKFDDISSYDLKREDLISIILIQLSSLYYEDKKCFSKVDITDENNLYIYLSQEFQHICIDSQIALCYTYEGEKIDI